MPPSDELAAAIRRAGYAWTARDVSDDDRRGLGWEPTPARRLRSAIASATALKALAAAGPPPPPAFDWRSRGVIGPAVDQGFCGSCVSFATTGLVSSMAAIELGAHELELSEADQHFCSSHGANCGGWNNGDALNQIATRGVAVEGELPYMSAFDDPPQTDPNDSEHQWLAHCRAEPLRDINTYKISESHAWSGDDRKSYLASVGPMVCGFIVYTDFDSYGGGVYRHVQGTSRGGHCVLVVGYSDVDQAWICRNSWGPGFGGTARSDGTGDGFFKIGYGECGIDNEPFFGCHGVIPPVQRLRLGLSALGAGALYAGWKSDHGDDRVFFSSTKGDGTWTAPLPIAGIGSSTGPVFASFEGKISAAWKGVGNDQSIWWSTFDGNTWTMQQKVEGVGTSVGPALAVFDARLYAAWVGADPDESIWWSTFDRSQWSGQQKITGVGSTHGPALAVFQNELVAAWKGAGNDQSIWWSTFDGNAWSAQQKVEGVGTSVGPALAVLGSQLYALWKGVANDQSIWWSTFDGNRWAQQQQQASGMGTSVGPVVAVFDEKLYAVWKGQGDDSRLWSASFDGQRWSPPVLLPGTSCPD